MRKIILEFDESRRRKSGGAAVVLIALGLIVAAASQKEPAVVTKTVTLTQMVAVPQTNPPTQTTSTVPPPSLSAPQLVVDRTTLRFARPGVQFVHLRNGGDQPLLAALVSAEKPFEISNDCARPLSKDASCTVAVAFAPGSPGRATTSFSIGGNGGTATIRLIGDAPLPQPPPTIELQPIDFGKRIVGKPGEPQLRRLSNLGNASLEVRGAATHAPFNIVRDGCQGVVPPGGSCDVILDFDPTTQGPQRDELRIFGANAAVLAHASLSGDASVEQPIKLDFNPRFVDFPPLSLRRAQTVAVSNPGERATVIRGVVIEPNDGTFSVKTDCTGQTLAPKQPPCHVTVYCQRVFTSGARTAKIKVLYDGGWDEADVTAHSRQSPRPVR